MHKPAKFAFGALIVWYFVNNFIWMRQFQNLEEANRKLTQRRDNLHRFNRTILMNVDNATIERIHNDYKFYEIVSEQ